MNSILSSLRNLFGGKPKTVSPGELGEIDMMPPMEEIIPQKNPDFQPQDVKVDQPVENFSEQPPKRKVIQPPVLAQAENEIKNDILFH